MSNINSRSVILPENCVKFYTSSPIDNGIETKIPISLMQYDTEMAVVAFTILEKNTIYTIPESAEIKVRFEKPDGHGVYNSVIGVDENNVVYFNITYQMTVAYGSGTCCLEITYDGKTKYTKKVPVYISKNPVDDNSVESTDEYKAIMEIYEDVKRIGGIVEENQEAIQAIYENLDLIKRVPDLAQQTQDNATQVENDKNEVLSAKQSVDESLEKVLESEQNAKQSEQNAKLSEQNAKQSEITSEQNAQQTQQDASQTASDREYVESVMPNIEKADDYATESKSWAVGGTGTREGEDTNNSKYWAEQAAQIASGYLGYFDTPETLEQSHPTSENGKFAIVGSTNTIWIWNSAINKFVNDSDYSIRNVVLSVSSSSWVLNEGIYIADFSVTGCKETTYILGVNIKKQNGETITQDDINNLSNLFEYMETLNDKISLYSNSVPDISMDIIVSISN